MQTSESVQTTTRGLYSPVDFEAGITWLRIFLNNLYDQRLLREPCVTVNLVSLAGPLTMDVTSTTPPYIFPPIGLSPLTMSTATSVYCVWDLQITSLIHVEEVEVVMYMDSEANEGYSHRTAFIPAFWDRFRMDDNRQCFVIVHSIGERIEGAELAIIWPWATGPMRPTHIFYFDDAAPFVPAACVSLRHRMHVMQNEDDAGNWDGQTYTLWI
ncbi:hypothetical protein PLICRDRAFT_26784 [Plicaturopsis crispa FD-325 SS-3]|nr:hypothetical protein PLICRDRAFT_26784 [Plicaturopsis crispa FD-325 SS-3]